MLKTISRYVLATFYIAAGVNHFHNPDFYVAIMPEYLPMHLELVYVSGVFEILFGALLLDPKARPYAAWGIIALLLAFMTVHVDMIVHADRYPDVSLAFLWLRLPMQALFIAWAWWHTRPDDGAPAR